MREVKIVWLSTTGKPYFGAEWEVKKGFFASTPVKVSQEVFDKLKEGDTIEVPRECLT